MLSKLAMPCNYSTTDPLRTHVFQLFLEDYMEILLLCPVAALKLQREEIQGWMQTFAYLSLVQPAHFTGERTWSWGRRSSFHLLW
jgi:hypothetical protein